MKPFDLEAALRGEAVITRDGREVTELYYFKTNHSTAKLAVVIDGAIRWYDDLGKSRILGHEHFDLFMKSKTHKGWINIYSNSNKDGFLYKGVYPTESDATSWASSDCTARIQVEWEE